MATSLTIFGITLISYLFLYVLSGILISWIGRRKKLLLFRINGFKFLIRMFIVISFIVTILLFEDLPNVEYISISSILGVIIGFASTEIVGQFVSGIYLISSRPFKVGDLIQIENISGIVLEIGIIYTIIQRIDGTLIKVPNKNILNSKFKNYTIKLTPEIKKRRALGFQRKRKIEYTKDDKPNKWKDFWQELSENMEEHEITRFTFDFELDLSVPPQKVKGDLKQICQEYESIFGYLPKFNIQSIGIRLLIRFRIYSHIPQLILDNYSNLMLDISDRIYGDGG